MSESVELLKAIAVQMEAHTRLLQDQLQRMPSAETLMRLEAAISALTQARYGIATPVGAADTRSAELISGLNNQTTVLNDRAREIIAGMDNLSQLLNEKLGAINEHAAAAAASTLSKEIIAGMDNLSQLLNERLGAISTHALAIADQSVEIVQRIDVQSRTASDASKEVITGMSNLTRLINDKLGSVIKQLAEKSGLLSRFDTRISLQEGTASGPAGEAALQTSGRAVERSAVITLTGQLHNMDRRCQNDALSTLMQLRSGSRVEHDAWMQILHGSSEELRSLANAAVILQALEGRDDLRYRSAL